LASGSGGGRADRDRLARRHGRGRTAAGPTGDDDPFRQGSDPAANLGAVAPFGRIPWASAASDAVALEATKLASLRLYALGAALVSSTPVLGGCLNWAELRA